MGILDSYRQKLQEDRMNEDNSLPEGVEGSMSQEEEAEYQDVLKRMRADIDRDIEAKIQKQRAMVEKLSEEDLDVQGKLSAVEITRIFAKRAYCPYCGAELASKFPVAYNPFTKEKMCMYECSCGKRFNLEYAYPRLVFFDDNGEEVKAFGQ